MKKLMRTLTCFMLCVAMCLSVAACGGKDVTAKLKDYISENQEDIDSLKSVMSSSGMELSVDAEGSSLIYKFQYTVDIGDLDTAKSALETGMSAYDETFKQTLTQLKEEVSGAEAIKLVYLDKDGNEIYSKEFK